MGLNAAAIREVMSVAGAEILEATSTGEYSQPEISKNCMHFLDDFRNFSVDCDGEDDVDKPKT